MDEILWTLFFLFPILLGGGILFFIKRQKKTRISGKQKAQYFAAIAKNSEKSPSERMIACDKILSHILEDLGFHGTVADQLKQKPSILSRDLQEIWRLHKIRNTIAHELSSEFDEVGDPKSFEKILRTLLLKI